MDPMKNFEELKSRLEQTLKQAQQESTNFSETFIQSETSIEDNSHKFPLTRKKKAHLVNVMKTSQKPKVSRLTNVNSEYHEYQSCGEITPKSLNFIEQELPNMMNERQKIRENFNSRLMMKKPIECGEKCVKQIQRWKMALKVERSKIENYEMEIKKHQCEKVEYEQIVFELKTAKQILTYENNTLKNQIEKLKIQTLSKNETSISPNSNIEDLQSILSQLKKKVFDYQNQLVRKQTIYNHQHYLLEKLKHEQTELHTSQASLLEELEYVLKKLKNLKTQNQQNKIKNQTFQEQIQLLMAQNQEIKAENQEKSQQITILEDANSKLEQDLSQLFILVNDLQKEKSQLEDRFHQMASLTKKPLSDPNLKVSKQNEETFGNLNAFFSNRQKKSEKLSIRRCEQFSYEPLDLSKGYLENFLKKDEVSELTKKDEFSFETNKFSRSIELDDTYFFNELDLNRQTIHQLQKQLSQSRDAEREAWEEVQKVKVKLITLLRDLKMLESEHESMKRTFSQDKMKNFMWFHLV